MQIHLMLGLYVVVGGSGGSWAPGCPGLGCSTLTSVFVVVADADADCDAADAVVCSGCISAAGGGGRCGAFADADLCLACAFVSLGGRRCDAGPVNAGLSGSSSGLPGACMILRVAISANAANVAETLGRSCSVVASKFLDDAERVIVS